MLEVPEFKAFEQPVMTLVKAGGYAFSAQVWALPKAEDAEHLFAVLSALVDNPDVGTVALHPGNPLGETELARSNKVLVLWRNRRGTAAAEVRRQIHGKELRDFERVVDFTLKAKRQAADAGAMRTAVGSVSVKVEQ